MQSVLLASQSGSKRQSQAGSHAPARTRQTDRGSHVLTEARNTGLRLILNIFPAAFATAMTLIVFVFPDPSDLAQAFSLRGEPIEAPAIVVEDPPTEIRGTTEVSVSYTYQDFEAMGCATALENASPRKLEVCSTIIADAVIEVTRFESAQGVQTTMAERLLLAATHVCRASWAESNSPSIDFQNPACATSTLPLASLQ